MDFLEKHEEIVDDFNKNVYIKLLSNCRDPKEKFYAIFLDSINASGGLNLEYIANGCNYIISNFLAKAKVIDNKIYFKDYYSDINSLYFDLVNNVKFMHKKKSSLVIKGLFYVQNEEKLKIFHDLEIEKNELNIPIDIVICEILNSILLLNEDVYLEANKDFELINEWAKNNFKERFYLIESLWFWGYFNTRKLKNERSRKIVFNQDKFISNPWFYPETDLKLLECFKEFRELVSNK